MRERGVRMVHDAIADSGERVAAVTRVARNWAVDVSHWATGETGRNRQRQTARHGQRTPGFRDSAAAL